MSVQLQVDVRDTFSAALRQVMMRAGTLNEVLDDIGQSLETSTQQRFEDEQDPQGNDWQEHSETTKAIRGDDATILRDEIDLFDSITHKVSGSAVAVGTNRIYGRIQQLGGEAGRKSARVTIPARPYLGLSNDDKIEIGAIVTDHVKGGAT